tara:strand:+ start:4545 stop:4670 length:126 start_codon:yes stop_codon:yes gene_type:complete
MVTTNTDVPARMETGSTLANDDIASYDFLAAENLDAKAFAL